MALDLKSYVIGKQNGSGGTDITVEPLTITENGTTTAPSGKAYSPVNVNVEELLSFLNTADSLSPFYRSTRNDLPDPLVIDFSKTSIHQLPCLFGNSMSVNCKEIEIYMPEGDLYPVYGAICGGGTPVTGPEKITIRCGASNIVKINDYSSVSFAFFCRTLKIIDCILWLNNFEYSPNRWFSPNLEEVRFMPASLHYHYSSTDKNVGQNMLYECKNLSSESLISYVNALMPTETEDAVILTDECKATCNSTYVTYEEVTDDRGTYEIAVLSDVDTEGAITLTNYITQRKGYSLA